MKKQLLLSKIESEIIITLIEQELDFFKDELRDYIENKERVFKDIYSSYKEEEKEDLYKEEIVFFNNIILTYKDLLFNKLYNFRKRELVLVNEEDVEYIYIKLETLLDNLEDNLKEDLIEEERTYIESLIKIYKNIMRKIYNLELLKINKEAFDKYINN